MGEVLIKGVGKKVIVNADKIKVIKTIGKDIDIPLLWINEINYTEGTMSRNGNINIEWTDNVGNELKENIMFRCFSNDIVKEAIEGIQRYLEEPGQGLKIREKEKTGVFEQINKESKEQALQKIEKKQKEKDRLKQLQEQGIPYCPKCHSTHLQYIEHRKRLSIGRAVVGGALAGGVGAALGGLTSKKYKGKIKCLNCGHEWKL